MGQHKERLNKRLFRTYTNRFKDLSNVVSVSESDFELFLSDARRDGLAVLTDSGFVVVVPKKPSVAKNK